MRIFDAERKQTIHELYLYLTEADAKELVQAVQWLLERPEEMIHAHLSSDRSREVSLSILTPEKIRGIAAYSPEEQAAILES